jgi:hypothetical protein
VSRFWAGKDRAAVRIINRVLMFPMVFILVVVMFYVTAVMAMSFVFWVMLDYVDVIIPGITTVGSFMVFSPWAVIHSAVPIIVPNAPTMQDKPS